MNLFPLKFNGDLDGIAIAVSHPFHGHGGELVDRVGLHLPTILGEILSEVSFLISKGNANDGKIQITR